MYGNSECIGEPFYQGALDVAVKCEHEDVSSAYALLTYNDQDDDYRCTSGTIEMAVFVGGVLQQRRCRTKFRAPSLRPRPIFMPAPILLLHCGGDQLFMLWHCSGICSGIAQE